MSQRRLPPIVYRLMLISCALIWGSTFTILKGVIMVMPPSWLVGIRFMAAGTIMGVVLIPRLRRHFNKATLIGGVVLGVLIFGAYWFQTMGLFYTTPGKNAFLTDVYCVAVPFMFWFVARRRPTRYNMIAALMCIVGVGFVSLSSADRTINIGDILTIIGGLFFAGHIVATSILARTRDVLSMTVYQLWFSGALLVMTGIISEPMPDWQVFTDMEFVLSLAYLTVVASCIAYWFQNYAVAHVPPAPAAILLSLESIFGVIFSVVLYGEQLTGQLIIGFVLIFAAILVSEALPLKKPPNNIDASIVNDAGRME